MIDFFSGIDFWVKALLGLTVAATLGLVGLMIYAIANPSPTVSVDISDGETGCYSIETTMMPVMVGNVMTLQPVTHRKAIPCLK